MRNIIRSIAIAFGSKSALAAEVSETIANDSRLDRLQREKETVIRNKQYVEPVKAEALPGQVTTEDLTDFSSKYGRSAVASLGCWSAIARGFSEFVRNPKSNNTESFISEFHAWNAMCEERDQLDDDKTLAIVAKLSQVAPAKGNKQTDEVIARVLKKSLEEVAADRIAKAELKTRQREEQIISFNTALWATTYGDSVVGMPAQKVLDKLEQTLLWMATWDSSNPAALASELLLLESDINLVKRLGRSEAGATEDYVDGVMAADTLTRRTA